MLIDRYLPRYDMRSSHEIEIDAPPEVTYRVARELDLSDSPIAKVLFGLRSVPRLLAGGEGPPLNGLTLDTLLESGFKVLGEEPSEELVVGVVGQFWRPASGIRDVPAELFTQFERPGFAKATMNLRVRPRGAGSRFSTETRVLCIDAAARLRFKLYWTLIGPFSGFIRGEMLRSVKNNAERAAQASVGSL